MEVIVRINSTTPTGKKLLKDLKQYPEDVVFDNPAVSDTLPEGYIKSSDFWELQKLKTEKFCKENGVL